MELLRDNVDIYIHDPKKRCHLVQKGDYEFVLFVEEYNVVRDFVKRFPKASYEEISRKLKEWNLRHHGGIVNFAKNGTIIKSNVLPTRSQLASLRRSQLEEDVAEEIPEEVSEETIENEIEDLLIINRKKDGVLENIEYVSFIVNKVGNNHYLTIALD